MNYDEILGDIKGIMRGFRSDRLRAAGESIHAMETRQLGQLSELFGMLCVPPEEFLPTALDAAMQMMSRKHYSAASAFLSSIVHDKVAQMVALRKACGASLLPYELALRATSIYLTSASAALLLSRDDALMQSKDTASRVIHHLKDITAAIESLFPHDDDLYHAILNGTIFLFECCTVLVKHGFYRDAILFLGFASQCCECTSLMQVKYAPWKVRIYSAITLCYQSLGEPGHALQVTLHALSLIQELHALESSDAVPPPPHTLRTLNSCAASLRVLEMKYTVLKIEQGEPDETPAPTEKPDKKGKGGAAAAAASSGGITADSLSGLLQKVGVRLDPAPGGGGGGGGGGDATAAAVEAKLWEAGCRVSALLSILEGPAVAVRQGMEVYPDPQDLRHAQNYGGGGGVGTPLAPLSASTFSAVSGKLDEILTSYFESYRADYLNGLLTWEQQQSRSAAPHDDAEAVEGGDGGADQGGGDASTAAPHPPSPAVDAAHSRVLQHLVDFIAALQRYGAADLGAKWSEFLKGNSSADGVCGDRGWAAPASASASAAEGHSDVRLPALRTTFRISDCALRLRAAMASHAESFREATDSTPSGGDGTALHSPPTRGQVFADLLRPALPVLSEMAESLEAGLAGLSTLCTAHQRREAGLGKSTTTHTSTTSPQTQEGGDNRVVSFSPGSLTLDGSAAPRGCGGATAGGSPGLTQFPRTLREKSLLLRGAEASGGGSAAATTSPDPRRRRTHGASGGGAGAPHGASVSATASSEPSLDVVPEGAPPGKDLQVLDSEVCSFDSPAQYYGWVSSEALLSAALLLYKAVTNAGDPDVVQCLPAEGLRVVECVVQALLSIPQANLVFVAGVAQLFSTWCDKEVDSLFAAPAPPPPQGGGGGGVAGGAGSTTMASQPAVSATRSPQGYSAKPNASTAAGGGGGGGGGGGNTAATTLSLGDVSLPSFGSGGGGGGGGGGGASRSQAAAAHPAPPPLLHGAAENSESLRGIHAKEVFLVRQIRVLRRLLRAISSRRAAYARFHGRAQQQQQQQQPRQPKAGGYSGGGHAAARGALPGPNEGVVSESLLYKTLGVEHGLADAACARATMRYGILLLWQRALQDHHQKIATLLSRKAQSHLFGELSAKEEHILRHEMQRVIPRPVSDDDTTRRLLSERAASPHFTALAHISLAEYSASPKEALKKLSTAYRYALACQEALPDGGSACGRFSEGVSEGSLPVDFIWCQLACAAARYQGHALVRESGKVLRAKYTAQRLPTVEPRWAASPMAELEPDREAVAHAPVRLVVLVAKSLLAEAEAIVSSDGGAGVGAGQQNPDPPEAGVGGGDSRRCPQPTRPGGVTSTCHEVPEFHDDPDHSFDPQRYNLLQVQEGHMAAANTALLALTLARSAGSTPLVVATCHRLYDVLRPLLKPASPSPNLLRPLWAISRSLSELPAGDPATELPIHQALLVRVVHDLFATVNSAGQEVVLCDAATVTPPPPQLLAACAASLRDAWVAIGKNPNRHVRLRCATYDNLRKTFQLKSDIDDIQGILASGNGQYTLGGSMAGAGAAGSKKDAAAAGKNPPAGGAAPPEAESALPEVCITVNMLPQLTPHVSDAMPAEAFDLLGAVALGCPHAVPHILQTHEESAWLPPIYHAVLGRMHAEPGAALEELCAQFKRDPLFPQVATLLARCASRGGQAEQAASAVATTLQALDERRQSLNGIAIVCASNTVESLAKLKRGELPGAPAAAAGGKGDAKGGKAAAKGPAAGQDTQEGSGSPEEAKAKKQAFLLRWACLCLVHRRRVARVRELRYKLYLTDTPCRARLYEMSSAAAVSESVGVKQGILAAAADRATPDGAEGGGGGALSDEETNNFWRSDVVCIRHITRAASLFSRIRRWKHACNAMTSLANALNLFFPDAIPFVLNVPDSAKSSDPAFLPLHGITAVQAEVLGGTSPKDGLLLVRKELRSAVETIASLLEELGGVSGRGGAAGEGTAHPFYRDPTDLGCYLDTLSPRCIEAYCIPGLLSAAATTSLRLQTTDAGRAAYERYISESGLEAAGGSSATNPSNGQPPARPAQLAPLLEAEFVGRSAADAEEHAGYAEILREMSQLVGDGSGGGGGGGDDPSPVVGGEDAGGGDGGEVMVPEDIPGDSGDAAGMLESLRHDMSHLPLMQLSYWRPDPARFHAGSGGGDDASGRYCSTVVPVLRALCLPAAEGSGGAADAAVAAIPPLPASHLRAVLSSGPVAGRVLHFVKGFPPDLYTNSAYRGGVVLNIAGFPELLTCTALSDRLVIGAAASCRRAAQAIRSSKAPDAAMRAAADALAGNAPGSGDAAPTFLHPALFAECGCTAYVYDIFRREVIEMPIRELVENDFRINSEWCLLRYSLSPARGPGDTRGGSGKLRLSKRETAGDAQRCVDGGGVPGAGVAEADTLQAIQSRLGGVDLARLVGLAERAMRALQHSAAVASNLASVDSAEVINSLTNNKFAAQLIPISMVFLAASGRNVQKQGKLLASVFRDFPRSEVLMESGEIALESYASSTACQLATSEVAKDRENRGGRGTVVTSCRTTATGRKSLVRNEFYKEVCQRLGLAYAYFRQKHLPLPAMRVVDILGQLHTQHQARKEAATAWHEGVDIAFGHVNAWQKWRALTEEGGGEAALVARLGTTKIFVTVILLYKLASQSLLHRQHAAFEHCMLAAKLCKAVLSSCQSQPARECDFAKCPKEVLLGADPFSGPLGVDGKQLMFALAYVAAQCQKIGHAVMSLPAASLLEYVACECLRSSEYVLMARCLKVRALSAIGNPNAVSAILRSVTRAVGFPSLGLQQVEGTKPSGASGAPSPPPSAQGAKKPPAKKGAPAAKPDPNAAADGTPPPPDLLCNHRPLTTADRPILSAMAEPLPGHLRTAMPPSLASYFALSQSEALLRIASACPSLAVEGGKLTANDDGKQAYAAALELSETLASSVEALGSESGCGRRTLCAHAMHIRAGIHAARGNFHKSLDACSALLEYHTASYDIPSDVSDCETPVVSLGVADICNWHLLRAEVLLQLRRPQQSGEACADCEALAAKYEHIHGEREAKLLRARSYLQQGKDRDAASLLTQPQRSAGQPSAGEGGGGGGGDGGGAAAPALPDLGKVARVGAPTRLREAPDPHAALVVGGGLLEGMPVSVLQVDHGYTLVRSDEGAQGFMPTRDIRPGLQAQPRAPPPPPLRPSMVEEAAAMDCDSRDPFLPRLAALAAVAVYADEFEGRLDTALGAFYLPLTPCGGGGGGATQQRGPRGAGGARAGGEGVKAGEGTGGYRLLAARHYLRFLEHVGFDLTLGSNWKGLHNAHIPIAREATLACVHAGREMMLRNNYNEAESLFRKACAISTQCMDPFPYSRALAAHGLARCLRLACPDSAAAASPSQGGRTGPHRPPSPTTISQAAATATATSPAAAQRLVDTLEVACDDIPPALTHAEAVGLIEVHAAGTPAGAARAGRLQEAAGLLAESLQLCGTRAPYDYSLQHACCMELACIYTALAGAAQAVPDEPTRGQGACVLAAAHCLKLAADVAHQRRLLLLPQLAEAPLTHAFARAAPHPAKSLGLAKDVDAADISTLVAADVAELQRRSSTQQSVFAKGQGDPPPPERATLACFAQWLRASFLELPVAGLSSALPEVKLSEWRAVLQHLYSGAAAPGSEVVSRPSAPQLQPGSLLACSNAASDTFASSTSPGFAAAEAHVLLSQMFPVVDQQLPPRPVKPGEPVSDLPPLPALHWVVFCKRSVPVLQLREEGDGGGGAESRSVVGVRDVVVDQRDLRGVQGVCQKIVALVAAIMEREEELGAQADAEDSCGGAGGKKGAPAAKKGKDSAGVTPTPAVSRGMTPDVHAMEGEFDDLCIDFADAVQRLCEGARFNIGEEPTAVLSPTSPVSPVVPPGMFLPPLSVANREVMPDVHATAVMLASLFDPAIGVAAASSSCKHVEQVAVWLMELLNH